MQWGAGYIAALVALNRYQNRDKLLIKSEESKEHLRCFGCNSVIWEERFKNKDGKDICKYCYSKAC